MFRQLCVCVFVHLHNMTSDKVQKHFVLMQLSWKRNCCSSKTTPPFTHSQTHTSTISLALSLSFSLITHTNTLCVCWRIWKINVSDPSSLSSIRIELLWQSFSSSAMAAIQCRMNKKRFNSFFSVCLFFSHNGSPVGHDSTQIAIPP